MSKQVHWSPFMHARTAMLDFRPNLFAHPRWFSPEDIAAAVKFSQGSTLSASKLAIPDADGNLTQRPRWWQFSGPSFRAFGITADGAYLSERFTHELEADGRERRPIFAVVGLAASSELVAGLEPPRDPEVFRQIYGELIAPRWRETRDDRTWEEATRTGPGTAAEPRAVACKRVAPSPFVRKGEDSQLDFRPAAEGDRLWSQAAADGRISVLLGAPRPQLIRATPFEVISSEDIAEPLLVDRESRQQPTTGSKPKRKHAGARRPEQSHESVEAIMTRYAREEKKNRSANGIPLGPILAGAAVLAALTALGLILSNR